MRRPAHECENSQSNVKDNTLTRDMQNHLCMNERITHETTQGPVGSSAAVPQFGVAGSKDARV
jgi:hypothetical protein